MNATLFSMLKFEEIAQRYQMPMERLDQFPLSSGDYRISYNPGGRIYSDFAGNHPTCLPKGIVVDAGCSYGAVTNELCRIYPEHQVFGCDIEYDRLPKFKDSSPEVADRLKFAQGDIFHLDRLFEPASVACIYAMNNLTYLITEHWSELNDLLAAYLLVARFHRVLVQDGYVCISGTGDGVNGFAHAIFQKSAEGFNLVCCNENFTYSNGLYFLRRAFDLAVGYVGT